MSLEPPFAIPARAQALRAGPASRKYVPRRAFSLLEMTVVIGIIMLLMTLAVVGYKYISASNNKSATRVVLHNADAMVAEVDRVGSMPWLEGSAATIQTRAPYMTGQTLANPGAAYSGGAGRGTAISNSQYALKQLAFAPANHDAIGQLPAKMLVSNGSSPYNPPALADAWGNPIIFVPSGGLDGVRLGATSDSSGAVTFTQTVTITAPDHRPFWASAGPSGDFSNGDDNIYSFEK